jgi:cellulose synthase/poly-beta-1,6-N-acetylglucosamine synthase-like glycosyltransferase
MNVLLTVILSGIALVLLIPCTVLSIECLAAVLADDLRADSSKRPSKVAILMPAHNEAAVIAKTIGTILPQLQDGDRLIVIADNCEDATAEIARQLGVTAIERHNPHQRGKGYALDFGLQFLAADPPEIVILIDADNLVAPNAIAHLAACAASAGRPVQSNYIMEYPPNPTARDTISALAFLVKNQVRATGLARLQLPSLLVGTGMAFPWPILQKASLATGNIVEDLQLGIDLAIAGSPPIFCPQAKVIGLLPQQEKAAKTQRTRWEHGHLQTLSTQVPRLLKAAMKQKRWDLLVLALEIGVPPLSFLVMVLATASIVSLLAGIFSGIWIPLFLISLAGLLLLLAVFIAWFAFGSPVISGQALLSIPLYIVWKIPLYLAFLIRPEKQWIRTERDTISEP